MPFSKPASRLEVAIAFATCLLISVYTSRAIIQHGVTPVLERMDRIIDRLENLDVEQNNIQDITVYPFGKAVKKTAQAILEERKKNKQ